MFVSKFLGDTNFGLASFTILVYVTINNNNKIDSFTNSDGDRSKQFEIILWYNSPITFMRQLYQNAGSFHKCRNIFSFVKQFSFLELFFCKIWLSKWIPDQGLWDIHWREPLPEVSALLEESIHRALIGESKISISDILNLN